MQRIQDLFVLAENDQRNQKYRHKKWSRSAEFQQWLQQDALHIAASLVVGDLLDPGIVFRRVLRSLYVYQVLY